MLLATVELKLSSDSLMPSIAEAPALVCCLLLAPVDCAEPNADCFCFELEVADGVALARETFVLEAVVGASSDGGETQVGDASDEGGGGVPSALLTSSFRLVPSSRLASSLELALPSLGLLPGIGSCCNVALVTPCVPSDGR